jgi:hypothetical protein
MTEGGIKVTYHASHLLESDRQLCKHFLKEAGVEMPLHNAVLAEEEVGIDVVAGRSPMPI